MGHLFMSKRDREREENRERRRAFRKAEGAVADVKDRIKRMEREAAKEWQKARDALASGEKAVSQRALTSYRAAQVLTTKLEQKRWVFEQYLMKMESARTDQEFAAALGAVNKVVEINPELVEDVFDTAGEILGEQQDADRFWSTLYQREMDGVEGALHDHVPSIEDLSQQLAQEVSGEVGAASREVSVDLEKRISEGRDRVKKLLD